MFTDAGGTTFVFVTGSAKTGDDFARSVPPGLARIRVVAEAGRPAFPRIDQLERRETFHNPGSPVVSSDGGAGAVVWVLDTGAPRSAPLYGAAAPRPVLYAFDALSLRLLWRSPPGALFPSGKYNEPAVADGTVFVGTDRIQAFGLGAAVQAAPAAPPTTEPAMASDAGLAGGDIYRARCAACHDRGQPGTPPRATLARMTRARIEAALLGGVMRPMATGLSPAEVARVARFLTGAP